MLMKNEQQSPAKKTVLGVMSGTSLDGIDLVLVSFYFTDKWYYTVHQVLTQPYPEKWVRRLQGANRLNGEALTALDSAYTAYLAGQLKIFMQANATIDIDFISSHGHTVHHQPERGYTYQIGNLPSLAVLTQKKVVCDFRSADVALGGQGAPLVPGGEVHLFPDFDACVNLGGFANISVHEDQSVLAYDLCAVNTVLNVLAQEGGNLYDAGGEMARKGTIISALLTQLEALSFYAKNPPKSLGIEWVNTEVVPVLEAFSTFPLADRIHTYVIHIGQIIGQALPPQGKVLFSGGGVWNHYLMESIKANTTATIEIPSKEVVDFKEAILFAFLGKLRTMDQPNCLASVTGARHDHCSGEIFFP